MQNKKFLAYVLVDPRTNVPRYVGITTKSLEQRLAQHVRDVYYRPDLNKHKTVWFKQLFLNSLMPKIEQIAEFSNLEQLKLFEINYIKENKEKYKLINQTPGGDWVGFQSHSRESILKKKTTRPITLYNILGEKIADFEMTEDARRLYGLQGKACSHITQCCKHVRKHAYGYIWRYKDEPLGDISNIDPRSIYFHKIVAYSLEGIRVKEYNTYAEASKDIGDRSRGSNIRACCLGEQQSCKGYKFQLEPIFVYFNQDKYEKLIKSAKTVYLKQPNKKLRLINQFTSEGILVNQFKSLIDAGRYLGIKSARKLIKECCEGKRKIYLNFIWKYDEGAL